MALPSSWLCSKCTDYCSFSFANGLPFWVQRVAASPFLHSALTLYPLEQCSAVQFVLLFALSSFNLLLQRLLRLLCHELTLWFLVCLCQEGLGTSFRFQCISFSCSGSAEILLLSALLAQRELSAPGPSVCPMALFLSGGYSCLPLLSAVPYFEWLH